MVSALSLRLPRGRLLADVVTTYSGFLVNALCGFVTLTLLAKHLGPGDFGIAALANLFMSVLAGLAEPGIGTSLVRLASRPEMTAAAVDELVVVAIRLKLMIVAALCVLAFVLMPWVTSAIMHRPELTTLLRFCLLGSAPLSLAMFGGTLFQLRGAFRSNAAAIAGAGAVRAVVVVTLWWSGHLDLRTAVGSMILMNVIQFSLCVFWLRTIYQQLPRHCSGCRQMRELVSYAKYLFLWLLLGTLYPRADMLLLTHYSSDNRELGFYSAAAQLCLMVPLLMSSIDLVLLPRISALRAPGELASALAKGGLAALISLALLAPLALSAGPIVRLIFGEHYAAAVPVFRLLIFAAAVDLALSPLSNFWHALNRPGMLSVLNVVRLSLLVGVAFMAIPRLGIAGAALAVLVSTVLPLAGQAAVLRAAIRGQAAVQVRPEVAV